MRDRREHRLSASRKGFGFSSRSINTTIEPSQANRERRSKDCLAGLPLFDHGLSEIRYLFLNTPGAQPSDKSSTWQDQHPRPWLAVGRSGRLHQRGQRERPLRALYPAMICLSSFQDI